MPVFCLGAAPISDADTERGRSLSAGQERQKLHAGASQHCADDQEALHYASSVRSVAACELANSISGAARVCTLPVSQNLLCRVAVIRIL